MLYLNGKINVIIRKLQILNNYLMMSIYPIKIKIGQDTLMPHTPYISCMGGEKMKKKQGRRLNGRIRFTSWRNHLFKS